MSCVRSKGQPSKAIEPRAVAKSPSPDRYRYVLDRPIVAEPGKTWIYCGGATALLGRMIAKGTGKPLHAYAREALFDPAGIAVTE